MLPRLNARSRIPLLRPLRPPNGRPNQLQPRLFTQNSQLLLIAPRASCLRPQLPYLSQPTFRAQQTPFLQGQIIRLLSTETRQFVREQARLVGKFTIILWTFVILGLIAWKGYKDEVKERSNPTPDEWTWWSRELLRAARSAHDAAKERGAVDWAHLGSVYKRLLVRLEDPTLDGKDLLERDDGGLLIPGVGKAGYDISTKSWPWRACYFEAIMGSAAAAEHMDGMVMDTSRRIVWPREYVIGPSNPDPRPVASYMKAAPLEENCTEDFCDPPETFYVRVLTGAGFTTKQKLDAASSYGNWLEYKGLRESAEEVYKWGIDIAKSAIEGDISEVVNDRNVLQTNHSHRATPNLLRATTQLAIHQARTGEVASALPILLSVLRAKRTAPVSSMSEAEYDDYSDEQMQTDIGAAWTKIKRLLSPPAFPRPPPSGDSPLMRASDRPTCEESELMLYIGEILFTTSGDGKEGIRWTRQAVTIAEGDLQETVAPGADKNEVSRSARKCKECLTVGVDNWEAMLKRLSEQAAEREGGRKSSWFGGRSKDTTESIAEELAQVEKLKIRIIQEGIREQLAQQKGVNMFMS